jgi:hypothetical protein
MDINENFGFTLGMDKKKFDKSMEFLTRKFLLKQTDEPKKYNTRAIPLDVFRDLLEEHAELKPDINTVKYAQLSTVPTKIHKKKVLEPKFYSDFLYHGRDRIIRRLAIEISGIRYSVFSLSATFLQRALIEHTYNRLIVDYKIKRYLYEGREPGYEPHFADIHKLLLKHHDEIFLSNERHGLNNLQNVKEECDKVIHGKQEADPVLLESQAKKIRIFIEETINDKNRREMP